MTLLIFFTLALIGVSGPTLLKFTLIEFPPLILVAIRALIAILIILPFVYKEKLRPSSENLKFLIASSVLFSLNWIVFALGLNQTSVIMGQLQYLPTAVVVAILGYIFLKEKINKYQIFGCILILLGMAFLFYGSLVSHDILSFGKPLGNVLVLVGLFSWSTYLVVSRKISHIYSPKVIIFYNFIVTFILSLPLVLFSHELKGFSFANVGIESYISLFALSLLSSVIFFLLFQMLIKRTTAFYSSLVLYPIAILAALSGTIFFHEKLLPTLVIGALFVFSGVFIATTYTHIKSYIRK